MKLSLNVYFGSGSGNAQRLSESFVTELDSLGYQTSLTNLRDIRPEAICTDVPALFIVSTWGEGDPPPDAQPFCHDLAENMHELSRLRYAVVALGDSCFRNFCGCGVTLNAYLIRHGGKEFLPIEKLDVCFQPGFAAWKQHFLSEFPKIHQSPSSGRDWRLPLLVAA